MESTLELSKSSLARRLGDTAHVSPLLRKICQMSGCSENRVTEWLLKCAVDRGASHYERPFASDLPPDNPALTNEEVAVGLCLGQHPYNSVFIRAAAQLLSSSQTAAPRLARLAVMERVDPVLLHITQVAARFAPPAAGQICPPPPDQLQCPHGQPRLENLLRARPCDPGTFACGHGRLGR